MDQEWLPPANAELLADVQLGAGAAAAATWCPVNGLLAVAVRQHDRMACVYVISPHCVEHKVTLAVPLEGPEDGLVCVAWSPAGCRRVLLVGTKAGALSAWSQMPPAHSSGSQPDMLSPPVFTLGDWWCQSVGQLVPKQSTAHATGQPQQQQQQQRQEEDAPDHVLALRWLQPPSCWPYSSRVLQEQDFQAGSVANMFARAASHRRAGSCEQNGAGADGGQQPGTSAFHWVQPGTLAFAAVLSCGKAVVGWATWGVQGQLLWQLTPSQALVQAGDAAAEPVLLAADVAVTAAGVVIALATQQEPGKLLAVELSGNPLHHQCLSAALRQQRPALGVQALGACSLTAGVPCRVVSMAWDPHSEGQRLAVAACPADGASASRGGHVTLLAVSEQQSQQPQQGHSRCELAVVASAQVAQAPQPQQYAWLLDGLLVGRQLLDAHRLAPLPVSLPHPVGPQQGQHIAHRDPAALAASPHRVCVALACSSTSSGGDSSSSSSRASSRLLLYSVPPAAGASPAGSSAVGPTLAGRLVWSLLLQRHCWDLVQHLMHAAHPHPPEAPVAANSASRAAGVAAGVGAELQVQRVAQVLQLVDRKLAVQADEVFSMYALRWDSLKYAVVCRTPGLEAQAASIDLRLRLLVPVLELQVAAAGREEEARQAQQATSAQQASGSSAAVAAPSQPQPGASPAAAALAEYAMSVVELEVACVNTWLHRRVAAAAGTPASAGGASVQAVPCIRFMLDFRSNTKLVATFAKALELAKLKGAQRAYGLWKLLHKPLDGRSEQPQNWEDLLMELVPGPFELHTLSQPRAFPKCLLNLRLPPDQALRLLQASPEWQQVPVLSDADITAWAKRLGLLPASTLTAKVHYAQQAQLHSSFRQQLPQQQQPVAAPTLHAPAGGVQQLGAGLKRALPTQLAAAKRQRWAQQVRDALGSPAGGAGVGSAEVVDLVHMAWARPSALALQSVDGAVMARQTGPDASGRDGAGRQGPKQAGGIAHSWAYACPITAEMWWLGPAC